MPPGTTIRKFIDALQSRETHFTQVADNLFQNPGNLPNSEAQAWAEFQQPNALNTPLATNSPNIATFLQRRGMTPKELAHIDKWDDGEKERLRSRLASAITNNEAIKFHWELYGAAKESAEITDHTIIFRSPQRGVRIGPAGASGEVEIDK